MNYPPTSHHGSKMSVRKLFNEPSPPPKWARRAGWEVYSGGKLSKCLSCREPASGQGTPMNLTKKIHSFFNVQMMLGGKRGERRYPKQAHSRHGHESKEISGLWVGEGKEIGNLGVHQRRHLYCYASCHWPCEAGHCRLQKGNSGEKEGDKRREQR